MFKKAKPKHAAEVVTKSSDVMKRPAIDMAYFEHEAEYWARAESGDQYNWVTHDHLAMSRLLGGMILQTKALRAEIEELKSAMIKVPPKN